MYHLKKLYHHHYHHHSNNSDGIKHDIFEILNNFQKPIICRINGPCLGGDDEDDDDDDDDNDDDDDVDVDAKICYLMMCYMMIMMYDVCRMLQIN